MSGRPGPSREAGAPPVRSRLHVALRAVVFAAGLASLGGCNGESRPELPVLVVGGHQVRTEVVATSSGRARGLMYRRELAEDHGMLFVYRHAKRLSFYMRNTLIPLSIAYLREDGTINDLHDMKRLDETPIPSEGEVKYALEMNQGWFERHGVKPGDPVAIPESIRSLSADP